MRSASPATAWGAQTLRGVAQRRALLACAGVADSLATAHTCTVSHLARPLRHLTRGSGVFASRGFLSFQVSIYFESRNLKRTNEMKIYEHKVSRSEVIELLENLSGAIELDNITSIKYQKIFQIKECNKVIQDDNKLHFFISKILLFPQGLYDTEESVSTIEFEYGELEEIISKVKIKTRW